MESTKNAPFNSKPRARTCPLMKLFGSNPAPHGVEDDLRRVRDLIYSHAWSRERRDDQKLDFVVSQWGINRNVPERFIPDTPYGTSAFQHSEKLRCNLHLVNKQISADFRRFIYSVNEVEIDIDLKHNSTKQAEDELQKIVALLQNPNFQEYTQTARIRVHFPSKCPADDLPTFNLRTLESIACTLDSFQQLQYLSIRVVPAQDDTFDHDLRLATFPFYPMQMTRWSIRIFNVNTHSWDLINSQLVQALDRAWEIYQRTGSLYLGDQACSTAKATSVKNCALPDTTATTLINRNGSQKRRTRRRKAAHTVFDKENSLENDSRASFESTQTSVVPSTPKEGPELTRVSSDAATASNIKFPRAEDPPGEENDACISGAVPTIKLKQASRDPSLPPTSPSKSQPDQKISKNGPSSGTSTGEAVVTPSESVTGEVSSLESSTNEADGNKQNLNLARISSPPPDSNVHDANTNACSSSETDGNHMEQSKGVETSKGERAKLSRARRSKKTKRKSKKARLSSADRFPKSDQTARIDETVLCEDNDEKQPISTEGIETATKDLPTGMSESNVMTLVTDQSNRSFYTLGDHNIAGASDNQEYCVTTGEGFQQWRVRFQNRTQMEMHRRQDARKREALVTKEAEKKETREKRSLKKAKSLHLRRENVATDSPVFRSMVARRERKSKDAHKHVVASKTATNPFLPETNNNMTIEQRNQYYTEDSPTVGRELPYRSIFDGAMDREIREVGEEERKYGRNDTEGFDFDSDHTLDFSDNEGSQSLRGPVTKKYTQSDFAAKDPPDDGIVGQDGTEYGRCMSEQSKKSPVSRPGQQAMHDASQKSKDSAKVPSPHRTDLVQAGCLNGRHIGVVQSLTREEALERRRQWSTEAQISDDVWYAQRKEQQARFEKQMEAEGTGYSDYDTPIHDKWTKTDEAGKCTEKGTEDIVYNEQT